ncbi:MAG: hypothetical protein HY057_08715 [Rhodospirillales bacterium]|nr:hypothetical protein [Rhodospirillales bacterium]
MVAQEHLPGVDDWPAIKITRRARRIVRHAYEEVITSCARLAAFAAARPAEGSSLINERQRDLAVEDLIAFAIHARRFIENTTGMNRFRSVEVRILNKNKSQQNLMSVTRIINILIHHQDISIVRTMLEIFVLAGHKLSIRDIVDHQSHGGISPIVYVSSKREPPVVFTVNELIGMFQDKILTPIIDLCDEHGFYLSWDDLNESVL